MNSLFQEPDLTEEQMKEISAEIHRTLIAMDSLNSNMKDLIAKMTNKKPNKQIHKSTIKFASESK
jgi:hypothetical protein